MLVSLSAVVRISQAGGGGMVYSGNCLSGCQYCNWCRKLHCFSPYRKPTSIGVPLGVSSAHNPSVYFSWPNSMVRRLAARSSTESIAVLHKQKLLDRYKAEYADDLTIAIIAKADPWKPSELSLPRPSALWLRLPYHPISCLLINRAVATFCEEEEYMRLYDIAFESVGAA